MTFLRNKNRDFLEYFFENLNHIYRPISLSIKNHIERQRVTSSRQRLKDVPLQEDPARIFLEKNRTADGFIPHRNLVTFSPVAKNLKTFLGTIV